MKRVASIKENPTKKEKDTVTVHALTWTEPFIQVTGLMIKKRVTESSSPRMELITKVNG